MKKTIKMNIPDYWGIGTKSPYKANKLKTNKKTKSAITSLSQTQNWKSDFWTKQKQFSWTDDKPTKVSKKNMNYKQANTYFSLSPIGDADNDGVPNWRDCRPFDKNRQGEHIDAFKKKLSDTKDKIQTKIPAIKTKPQLPEKPTKKTPEKKKTKQTTLAVLANQPIQKKPTPTPAANNQTNWNMLVKFPDTKWQKVADLKQGQIKNAVEEYKETFPAVEVVQVTQDSRLLGQLNRKLAVQKARKAVSNYTERQHFKENIKKGLPSKGSIGDDFSMDEPDEDIPISESPISMGPAPGIGQQPIAMAPSGPAQQTVNVNVSPGGDSTPFTPLESFNDPHTEPEVIGGADEEDEEEMNQDINTPLPPTSRPPSPFAAGPPGPRMPSPMEASERKIPPGTQRYKPVTMEQSTVRRPLLKAPHQSQPSMSLGMGGKIAGRGMLQQSTTKSTRPTGVMPLIDFKQAPAFRFMKFGKRVER